jgi:Ca2+-binding EF-hand superfamily protein
MTKNLKLGLVLGLAMTSIGGGMALAHGGGADGGECRGGGRDHGAKFDKNGDGKLDEAEKKAMEAARAQKKKELLDKYDANGDGQLDDSERDLIREERRMEHEQRMQERFVALDADKSGTLSKAEVAKELRLADHFDRIDADKNGQLSKAELEARRGHGKHGRHEGKGPQGKGPAKAK